MTRDASLDEFLGGDDGDEDEREEATSESADGEGGDAGTDEDSAPEAVDGADTSADGEAPPHSPEAVEPARSTYDWSPAGAECAACGTTVEARWRDDAGLVCPDCKDW